MSSDELMAFYEDCFTVLSKQEFLLPNREAMYCAIQAVMYTLIEYANEHGRQKAFELITGNKNKDNDHYYQPHQVLPENPTLARFIKDILAD